MKVLFNSSSRRLYSQSIGQKRNISGVSNLDSVSFSGQRKKAENLSVGSIFTVLGGNDTGGKFLCVGKNLEPRGINRHGDDNHTCTAITAIPLGEPVNFEASQDTFEIDRVSLSAYHSIPYTFGVGR